MKLKEKFQRFWTLSKSREGFTLVELIVVIAILAILAGVAIPVYNGYIKKANTAADQTLLDSVNTAFTAACIENGFSQYDVATANLPVNADNTIGTLSGVKLADGTDVTSVVRKSFEFYFAGNESATFNTFKSLPYNSVMAMFTGSEVFSVNLPGGGTMDLTDEQRELFLSSTYQSIGGTGLAGQVDTVSDLAALLIKDGFDKFEETGNAPTDNSFYNMVMSDGYWDSIGLTAEKAAAMSSEELSNYLANSLVLSAANATATYDADTALEKLQSDPTAFIGDIKTRLNQADQSALADAALIYGVYTSYVYATDPENASTKLDTVDSSAGLIEALTAMQNPEGDFNSYMNGQGKEDLNAYLEAMKLIGNASQDDGTADAVLNNGFTDDEIVGLLQQVLGK